MKDVLRSALGTFFLLLLLLALLLGAVKIKILQEKFWTEAIQKSGALSQVLINLDDLQRQSDAITKSKGLPRIIIKDLLNEKRLQDLTTTNIQRLLAFLDGKASEIIVYLPFQEWGFPGVKLAKNINITEILTAQNLPTEQKQQIVSGLQTFQLVSKNVGIISLGIFVLAFVLLAGHGLLGELKGTGTLLVVAGVIAAILGKVGEGFSWLVTQNPKLPAWGKLLVQQLIKDFFSFGMAVGLIIAGVGVVMVFKFKSQNKNLILGIIKNMAGVILALLLMGITVFGIVYKLEPKQNWSLSVPKDWTTREEKNTKFFTNTIISISVTPLIRSPEMDKKDYLQQVVKKLSGSTYQRTFIDSPYQDQWQGWRRSIFVYDITDPKSKEKVRTLHWELLPVSGNGYEISAASRSTDWEAYENQIISILESFKTK